MTAVTGGWSDTWRTDLGYASVRFSRYQTATSDDILYVSRAESTLACEACRRRRRSATEGMHGRLGGQTVYVLQLVKAAFEGSASC